MKPKTTKPPVFGDNTTTQFDDDGFAKIPASGAEKSYTLPGAEIATPQPAAQTQALAVKADMPLAAVSGSRGLEEVGSEDLIIPRVKLLQPLSPELKDHKDLRAGMIINSLTHTELPALFTPIFYWKEWLRFNPRDNKSADFDSNFEPGALMWRTRDANDPRVKEAEFGPNGEPPKALTTLNFFSVFDGDAMPVILSFSKTSYKAGKNLLSLAKLRGGDMFSRRYKLGVKEESNAKGDYYVLVVNPAGDCDAATFKTGEDYFNRFGVKKQALNTHVDGIE